MRRRAFIALVGGAAAAWPLAAHAALASEASGQRGNSGVRAPDTRPEPGSSAHAQQAKPIIGFLRSTTFADAAHLVAALRQGLKEASFVDGQNVTIEYRSAEDHHNHDRLSALVAELIRRQARVLVGNTPSALIAKAATTTVPIVFVTGGDPVRDGLVANLNRPGGNITGVTFFGALLGAKRLELLRQAAPAATVIALLVNPGFPDSEAERKDVQAAAQAIGQQLITLDASSEREIEAAFATLVQRGAGALLVGPGAFFNSNRERLAALAARQALPASFSSREAAVAGGLMSYGASPTDAYRQAGIYAGRILKGEKPGDLPVMQPTKYELVINMRTAKALGINIAPTLLALADEVIE
jgi:putative tryptophan/tyrosine transport system substrate-binding protein